MSSKPNHCRGHTRVLERGPRYENRNPAAGCNATHVAKGRKAWKTITRRAERRKGKDLAMEQPDYLLEAGTKIKTHETLGQTKGFLIRQDYLDNRKPNTEGTIRGIVGGHGGDVYWVENEDHSIAAYMFTEFELVDA